MIGDLCKVKYDHKIMSISAGDICLFLNEYYKPDDEGGRFYYTFIHFGKVKTLRSYHTFNIWFEVL